jgi:hypothetical protein
MVSWVGVPHGLARVATARAGRRDGRAEGSLIRHILYDIPFYSSMASRPRGRAGAPEDLLKSKKKIHPWFLRLVYREIAEIQEQELSAPPYTVQLYFQDIK